MHLPGFTAQDSVCRSTVYYSNRGRRAESTKRQAAVGQLSWCTSCNPIPGSPDKGTETCCIDTALPGGPACTVDIPCDPAFCHPCGLCRKPGAYDKCYNDCFDRCLRQFGSNPTSIGICGCNCDCCCMPGSCEGCPPLPF